MDCKDMMGLVCLDACWSPVGRPARDGSVVIKASHTRITYKVLIGK